MSKQHDIMQAALELFVEQGFHGTSVQMIATRMGVATGLLYRYFASNEALIRALYRQCTDDMVAWLNQGAPLDEVSYTCYRRVWFNTFSVIQNHRSVIRFRELYERSPFFCAEDTEWASQRWQPLLEFFQQGSRCGLLLDMPPQILAALSLGTLRSFMHECQFHEFVMTDTLKEQMAAASWKAILATNLSEQPRSTQ